jgi:hypothetical protein
MDPDVDQFLLNTKPDHSSDAVDVLVDRGSAQTRRNHVLANELQRERAKLRNRRSAE